MFGVYLRVRILTFFVIKVLKEVLLKKTKQKQYLLTYLLLFHPSVMDTPWCSHCHICHIFECYLQV